MVPIECGRGVVDPLDNDELAARDAGGLDTAQRANGIWKQQLRDYEAPPLDAGLDEALTEFMARRKEVLPDSVS